MDETLYKQFEVLVLQGLTVQGIRNKLGDVLEDFSDTYLVQQMLDILK